MTRNSKIALGAQKGRGNTTLREGDRNQGTLQGRVAFVLILKYEKDSDLDPLRTVWAKTWWQENDGAGWKKSPSGLGAAESTGGKYRERESWEGGLGQKQGRC